MMTDSFVHKCSTPLDPTLLDTCQNLNREWTQIACDRFYSAALTSKGELFTWGVNEKGQLGHGDEVKRKVPTKVAALDGLVITQIFCGATHMAVLTEKGEIFTWFVRS